MPNYSHGTGNTDLNTVETAAILGQHHNSLLNDMHAAIGLTGPPTGKLTITHQDNLHSNNNPSAIFTYSIPPSGTVEGYDVQLHMHSGFSHNSLFINKWGGPRPKPTGFMPHTVPANVTHYQPVADSVHAYVSDIDPNNPHKQLPGF